MKNLILPIKKTNKLNKLKTMKTNCTLFNLNLEPGETTTTKNLYFSFENQGFGAVAIAAERIAKGEAICFDIFNRDNKTDSCELTYKGKKYFGLHDIGSDDEIDIAFRVSDVQNLDANGSHSLIASWYRTQVDNPIYIAARLQLFLTREATDYFINN
jgi:hypothetical protein